MPRQTNQTPVTDNTKERARNYVNSVKSRIGREPTFEDMIVDLIESFGYEKTEDTFNAYEKIFKSIGLDTVNSGNIYNKYFNASTIFQSFVDKDFEEEKEMSAIELLFNESKSFIRYVLNPILDRYKWSKAHVLDFLLSLIPSIIILYFLRNEMLIIPIKWSIIGFTTSLGLFLLYKINSYLEDVKNITFNIYKPKNTTIIWSFLGLLIGISFLLTYIIFFLGVFLALPVLTVIFFFYFLIVVIKEMITKKNISDLPHLLYLIGMCLPIYFFFGTLIFGVNYFDGKYCTTVIIESKSNYGEYDLTVEVSGNQLLRIYFPNGGWLDKSHFIPKTVKIEGDGYCSFKDDRGREIHFFLSENEKGSCN